MTFFEVALLECVFRTIDVSEHRRVTNGTCKKLVCGKIIVSNKFLKKKVKKCIVGFLSVLERILKGFRLPHFYYTSRQTFFYTLISKNYI